MITTRFFNFDDNYAATVEKKIRALKPGPHRVNGVAVLVIHREDDGYFTYHSKNHRRLYGS